ncbi:hypothetical protein [Anabaena sp. UHCC 0451]|uniref:hypothetical protein n=1 Tax=Anabaena sp. UHCC 0451 TaxID=2055235 RepID=UPI002B1E9194|nr:hypothetical protein [Anabaena sp. UHCC 0451]MEA5577173.1 hypothetical protein [Anabaena sp. UHCC 0451]
MSELIYYRSVKSLDLWKKGKENKVILSPENPDTSRYIRDIKEGKGFPSLWFSASPENLEKIALGILLGKGHLEPIKLVGFYECCFTDNNLQLKQVNNGNFPIPQVSNLHYELCTVDDNDLMSAITTFMQCNGKFVEFFKANPDKNNMKKISAKYINEVSDRYKEKAEKWGNE